MKCSMRLAIAAAVLCGAIPCQGSLWAQGTSADETLSHRCEFVRAAIAADKLIDMLGDPKEAQPAGKNGKAIKPHTITYNDRTNTVTVTGSPDKINLAKQVLGKIDVRDKQVKRHPPEAPLMLKSYLLPAGNAESAAKLLQEFYRTSTTRVEPVGTTQIMVCAPGAEQLEIAEVLKRALPPQGIAGVFALQSAEAKKINGLVLDKLSKDPGAPLVRCDTSYNIVVVYGSPNQVEAVRLMIESLSGEKVQASKDQ